MSIPFSAYDAQDFAAWKKAEEEKKRKAEEEKRLDSTQKGLDSDKKKWEKAQSAAATPSAKSTQTSGTSGETSHSLGRGVYLPGQDTAPGTFNSTQNIQSKSPYLFAQPRLESPGVFEDSDDPLMKAAIEKVLMDEYFLRNGKMPAYQQLMDGLGKERI